MPKIMLDYSVKPLAKTVFGAWYLANVLAPSLKELKQKGDFSYNKLHNLCCSKRFVLINKLKTDYDFSKAVITDYKMHQSQKYNLQQQMLVQQFKEIVNEFDKHSKINWNAFIEERIHLGQQLNYKVDNKIYDNTIEYIAFDLILQSNESMRKSIFWDKNDKQLARDNVSELEIANLNKMIEKAKLQRLSR